MQKTEKNLSSTEISEILSGVIGKKGAAKIEISGDKTSLIDALVKNLGLPKSSAEMVANNCLSAALAKGIGNKTHLNIQVSNMPMHKSVNIVPHETLHALYRTFSFDILFTKFLEKTSLGRKYLQKIMTKSEMINDKNIRLQSNLMRLTGWNDAAGGIALEKARTDALFEVTKCTDKQILREQIKKILYEKKVLEIGNDKQNNLVLKTVIAGLKDESRAYNAGASVEKLYRQSLQDGSHIATTKSEIVADIYDEAVQVMKTERRHIQKNRLKEFFGLKANRSKEKEILDSFQSSLSGELRPCTAEEILIMYRAEIISAEECIKFLKDLGLSTENINEAMKRISLKA
jgi:flagellin-specific chaperone FliS